MKILIVSHSDVVGGAGRAAHRLHSGFRRHGFDSSMLVRRKVSTDPTVECATGRFARWAEMFRAHAENAAQRLPEFRDAGFVSLNLIPTRWSREIDAAGADVVNLHWFGSGALSIGDVGRIGSPVVMTLHDMWAFSGAGHFPDAGADAWWRIDRGGSGGRSTRRSPRGLSRRVWLAKQRLWRPVSVICPSRWLADTARDSVVMQGWQIHAIPNVVDTDLFEPMPRRTARERLGLPLDVPIVLFGAAGGGAADHRKGFDLLVEALSRLSAGGVRFLGVVFGRAEPRDHPLPGTPLEWMGRIDDDRLLACIYSAADVMVVPSRQDPLPQTASEAHSCGTPVVAFDATGLPDIVVHRETGYLAQPFSTEDLAHGIRWVLEEPERPDALGRAARERAVGRWHASVVVPRYERVLREACGHPSRGIEDG